MTMRGDSFIVMIVEYAGIVKGSELNARGNPVMD